MYKNKTNVEPITLEEVKNLPFKDLYNCADNSTKELLKQRAVEKLRSFDWQKYDYKDLNETLEFFLGDEFSNYSLEDMNILAENVLKQMQ
jgi:hypothetical protein